MVKPPRIRHSKPRRDPVTIDLEASSVENGPAKPEPAADAAAQPTTGSSEAARTDVNEAKPGEPSVPPAASQTDALSPAADAAARDTAEPSAVEAEVQRAARESAESKQAPGATAPRPAIDDDFDDSSFFGRDAAKAGVSSNSTAATDASTSRGPAPQSRRGGAAAFAAGILGAVVALAGAGALQMSGVLPSLGKDADTTAGMAALRSEITALREQVQALPAQGGAPEGLAQRVDQLATALDEARAEFGAVAADGQTDPAAMQAMNDRFAALEAAVAALPSSESGAAPVDLTPVNEKIAALETSVADAGRMAADAAKAATDAASAAQGSGERIGQLEQTVTDLSARLEEQAAQPQAALAIAASGLKAAIDRGEPFTTELDTYAAVAPETAEIEPLRAMAASGVPSRADIAAGFDAAAAAMLAAGRTKEPNAGFLDKLMTSAQSLVQVRPVGEVEGEGAPAAIARMEVAVDKGDYAAALKEYDTLPEASKTAGAGYAQTLRARLAADELMDKVLAAALKA